jgi:hypothetical protein
LPPPILIATNSGQSTGGIRERGERVALRRGTKVNATETGTESHSEHSDVATHVEGYMAWQRR